MIGLTVFLITAIFPLTGMYTKKAPLSIALAETNFKANIHTDAQEYNKQTLELKREVERIAREHPEADIVVLPEDVRLLSRLQRENIELTDYLHNLFPDKEVLLIDSGRTQTPEGVINRTYFISSVRGIIGVSNKEFFLPLGEYMPYIYEALFRALGQGEKVDRLKKERAYVPGGQSSAISFLGERLGALSCSEVLSPSLYRHLVKGEGATLLINLSSLSWFHGGVNPFNQLLLIARVHAVSNGTWYFQATNAGPPVVIDPYGKVRSPQQW